MNSRTITNREIDISVVWSTKDRRTKIARHKDKMVGKAVWREHQSKTARKPGVRVRKAKDR